MKTINENYEVVVVGGGLSGMCAAISAARHGAKTALIHNRPVLGGNASSEIRMHICGADKHAQRKNARETGILEEILLNNKSRGCDHSWATFDLCMYEICAYQENLTLHLNTHMDDVVCENKKVKSLHAVCLMNETEYNITGSIFIDCTGDATLGYMAGADYMLGREDKNEFNEPDGLDEPDNFTMGNSVMFESRDTGHPVEFIKPEWAYTYTDKDLCHRNHDDIKSGYWWIELGGKTLDTIYDAEELRDELLKTVYGIWDHIKNGGDHGAENYELEWVGMLPGKRESRRLKGDYILCENDLLECKRFDDAVAYGGWDMDCHVIEGFKSGSEEPTKYIRFNDVYTIPYRSLYSNSVSNLMLGGRAISASHLAFASTRVMGTCAVCGQAAGTAAAMAIEKNCSVSKIGENISELQQKLLKDDCYIPGVKNCDKNDLALSASIIASSEKSAAENVINGITRKVGETENAWISDGISKNGEWIEIKLNNQTKIKEVNIKFDSNLSTEINISISNWVKSRQEKTLPSTLVKDYDLVFYNGENETKRIHFEKNIQRYNKIVLDSGVICDKIRLHCYTTYGDKDIRVFEIRAY